MKRVKAKNSFKNSKNTKIVLSIFALIFISTVFVYALNTRDTGYKIDPTKSMTIDNWSRCRIVTNNEILPIFVPTKSASEWYTFTDKKPANVFVSFCGCVPNCVGRICGPDPTCGISCGVCPTGQTCNSLGTACISCISNCDGKVCGESDGCGGVCTYCESGKRCELTTYGYLCVRDDDPGDEEGGCGDNLCNAYEGEDCSNCQQDCGICPYCGDGVCNNQETCSTCPNDCAELCDCSAKCDNDLEYCNSLCDMWDCLWWSELDERCASCRDQCDDAYFGCIIGPDGCGYSETCPPWGCDSSA